MIFDSFPAQAGEARGTVAAYMIAMMDSKPEAIRSVLLQVIKGTKSDFDGKFRPTPFQLGAWCREQERDMDRMERMRSTEYVSYPIGGKPPQGYVALGEDRKPPKEISDD